MKYTPWLSRISLEDGMSPPEVTAVILSLSLSLGAGYWWVLRPRLRSARLRKALVPLQDIARLHDQVREASQAQRRLAGVVQELRLLKEDARKAHRRARGMPFPSPGQAASGEDAGTAMSRIAKAFGDPRLGVAVAGGEQLINNVFDMVTPETLSHLHEALKVLHDGGALHIMKGVLKSGAHGGLGATARHVAGEMLDGHSFGEAVHGITDSVGEAAHEVGEAFDPSAADGFHFPFVTLLMSTVREGALLLDDKISLERAVGHVVLTTGGAMAGSLGGAKAGALLGSVVPGIGNVIGGVVGAVLGGMGGRHLANKVKQQPLKNALAQYQSTFDSVQEELKHKAHEAVASIQASADRARDGYVAALGDEAPEPSASAGQELSLKVKELLGRYSDSLAGLEQAMHQGRGQLLAGVSSESLAVRMGGVSVRDEATQRWDEGVKDFNLMLLQVAAQTQALRVEPSGFIKVLNFLSTAPLRSSVTMEKALDSLTSEAIAWRERYAQELARWAVQVTNHYQQSVVSVARSATLQGETYREAQHKGQSRINTFAETVRKEQRALGLA